VKEVVLPGEGSNSTAGGRMRSVTTPVRVWWVKSSAANLSGWIAIDYGDVAGSAPHYEDNPPHCPNSNM
jgi:hypothetical protein